MKKFSTKVTIYITVLIVLLIGFGILYTNSSETTIIAPGYENNQTTVPTI